MILQCVLVGQKIFPTRDDAKLGLVWHHHSLKISFGLREHTVMPYFTNETKPSKGKIDCP